MQFNTPNIRNILNRGYASTYTLLIGISTKKGFVWIKSVYETRNALVGRGNGHWMRRGVLLHHLIKTLINYPYLLTLHAYCLSRYVFIICSISLAGHQVKKRLHRNSACGPRPLSILPTAISPSSSSCNWIFRKVFFLNQMFCVLISLNWHAAQGRLARPNPL